MNKNTLTKTSVVCLLAMLCCFLWGSAFPCVKIGYQMFHIGSADSASQLLFAGVRFTLAGILVLLIGSMRNKRIMIPPRDALPPIFSLALVQTFLQYLFFYMGLAHTTGVKSSIIVASNVFLSILIASLLFRYEKFTAVKCIGCLIGFGGVVLINLSTGSWDMHMSLTGEGAILLSAVSYSFSSVLVKKYSAQHDPVLLSGCQFFAGGILLTLCGAAFGGRLSGFTPASTALILYMAFISAAAYTVWSILLKYNPVSKVAVFGFMNPVFGVLLSALLLHEKNQAFTLTGLISLLLVCAGIAIVNLNSSRNKILKSRDTKDGSDART